MLLLSYRFHDPSLIFSFVKLNPSGWLLAAQSKVPKPAVLLPPESLLEMQILKVHRRPIESEDFQVTAMHIEGRDTQL